MLLEKQGRGLFLKLFSTFLSTVIVRSVTVFFCVSKVLCLCAFMLKLSPGKLVVGCEHFTLGHWQTRGVCEKVGGLRRGQSLTLYAAA